MITWSNYRDEIFDLNSKGHKSLEILLKLREMHPDVVFPNHGDRKIRLILEKRALFDLSQKHNVDYDTIKGAWVKPSKEVSFYVRPEESQTESLMEAILVSIEKHSKTVAPVRYIRNQDTDFFDRLVFSDTHIGMNPDPEGISVYPVTWNRDNILKRRDDMVTEVLHNSKGKVLYIDDLGDFHDGYEGFTTRGGHKLPQSMSTAESFDLALEFKIGLVDALMPYFEAIILNNVCNDNHAGSVAYMINSSVEKILKTRYKDYIEVNNIKKFIHHYKVGIHSFVISHGKDKDLMKFAFPLKLDAKTSQKIDDYFKHNNLYDKGICEFGKGDSHVGIYDTGSSDYFDYFSYPSLSPQSDWVAMNFKKGTSGFCFFNISYNSAKRNIYPYSYSR